MKTPGQIRLLLNAARVLGIAFTDAQAPGAWPNGSRLVKTKLEKGDAHQIGAMATVIGSLGPARDEQTGATYGYFVLWDEPPGDYVPVFVVDSRVALATADSAAGGRN